MRQSFPSELRLENGDRVGVIGGGPAGSFFSLFLLSLARRVGLELEVDICEPRDFSRPGPQGCNMCGGIVSESLVENLAMEGINLPPSVVQRGIDSYVLHTDAGSVRIETPLQEKRIAAVHRGAGPRGVENHEWESLDGFLQRLALDKGARWVPQRMSGIRWHEGRPEVTLKDGTARTYDLLGVAVGVNSTALGLFEALEIGYRAPATAKTWVHEYHLGDTALRWHLGSAMHVFLPSVPGLEFAALIPKGEHATVCLLGTEMEKSQLEAFMGSPTVAACFPRNWHWEDGRCHCAPRINIKRARQPFGDRMVFLGDSGVTRLYKDGIGAAYRTAKAAATTAVLEGISAEDFRRYYWPVCRSMSRDNAIGKGIFFFARRIQRRRFALSAILRMATWEQQRRTGPRRMSTVLWDMFTGSAPYKEIWVRTMHPLFVLRFAWAALRGILSRFGRKGKRQLQARTVGG